MEEQEVAPSFPMHLERRAQKKGKSGTRGQLIVIGLTISYLIGICMNFVQY